MADAKPSEAKASYEQTRATEPEGALLPPWDELSTALRIAFVIAFRDGGHHTLDEFTKR
jgi:hypothetical protein